MPGCKRPLIQPSGAWVGTVSHIVAAEDKGPRANPKMENEARRAFDNLILFCATHGREVDDVKTGAARFPVADLQAMKQAHEAKFAAVVERMIVSATVPGPSIADMADVGVRSSSAATSGARLLDYLGLTDPDDIDDVIVGLEQCRQALVLLSQPALDCLALLMTLWESKLGRDPNGVVDYKDPPTIHYTLLANRIGNRAAVLDLLGELDNRSLLQFPDRDDEPQWQEYLLSTSWTESVSWATIGWYLGELGIGRLSAWLPSLDFSVFD